MTKVKCKIDQSVGRVNSSDSSTLKVIESRLDVCDEINAGDDADEEIDDGANDGGGDGGGGGGTDVVDTADDKAVKA